MFTNKELADFDKVGSTSQGGIFGAGRSGTGGPTSPMNKNPMPGAT